MLDSARCPALSTPPIHSAAAASPAGSRGASDTAAVKELAKTRGRFGIRVDALVPGAIAAGGFVADPALARHIPLKNTPMRFFGGC